MLLEKEGLSIEILNKLSYNTSLNLSLKKNLHYFDKEMLLNDIQSYTEWLDEHRLLTTIKMDYRIKSLHSIELKYQRYFPDSQMRKVFNDILGFRGLCDNYQEVFELEKLPNMKVVDLTKGKANDDGYRGIHIYFQINNAYYPIEIQYNTYYDRQLNNWLHKYLYKKGLASSIGCIMRKEYESGNIKNEKEFKEVLDNVLSNSKEI